MGVLSSIPGNPSVPPIPPFSFELALARMEGDEELLRDVISILLEDAPDRLEALRAAARRGDLGALGRAAHGIKGAVSSLGARSATAAFEALETAARRSDPLAFGLHLARAEEAWRDLEKELRRWASAP